LQQTDNSVNGFNLMLIFIFLTFILFQSIYLLNSGTGEKGKEKPDRLMLTHDLEYNYLYTLIYQKLHFLIANTTRSYLN